MAGFDMPTTRDHGWLKPGAPKQSSRPARGMGRGSVAKDGKPMPLPNDSELRSMAHAQCVDHAKVEGLKQPVCIRKGQDREAVIVEARELAGPVSS